MPTVKSLHIYPIKGMRALDLPAARLREAGFEHDRRWMLVDAAGTFLSQRTHAVFTQFVPEIRDGWMHVRFGAEHVRFSLSETSDTTLPVTVFDDRMRAAEVDTDVSAWFSDHLHEHVRLVRRTAATSRPKAFAKYVGPDAARTTTQVSFADGYPYLILGTASLELLNEKLATPLPPDRFRANIYLNTTEPHEEDTYRNLTIGSERMLVVKPCARCQVTTIDQRTGARGREPLRTLATYRRRGNGIDFGANAVAVTEGTIRVGDRVRVG